MFHFLIRLFTAVSVSFVLINCGTPPKLGECEGGQCPENIQNINCVNGISDTTIDTLGRRCTDHCECNNQSHTGICIAGRCQSKKRGDCQVENLKEQCLLEIEKGCKVGIRICKDNGLNHIKWGDCKPIVPVPEQGADLCGDGIDNDCDGKIDKADPDCKEICQPGDIRSCYTGPQNTRKQGDCRDGEEKCDDDGKWSNKCEGEVLPKPEACNQKDDNCDGHIDEGLLGCSTNESCNKVGDTRPCYPAGKSGCNKKSGGSFLCVGTCKAGIQTCNKEKFWDICIGAIEPVTRESCDGKDDNCDGKIDEIYNVGQPCSDGRGTCEVHGKFVCKVDGSSTECTAKSKPNNEPEVCDGEDNNCDGQIDNNIAPQKCYPSNYLDKGCTREANNVYKCKGACSEGTQICKDGKWTECAGYILPKPEVCDGIDNNCDGTIDEDEICGCKPDSKSNCYPGSSTKCIFNTAKQQWDCIGTCAVGEKTCQSDKTWGQCLGFALPSQEICNGKDDDCDGYIDNVTTQTTPLSQSCFTGQPSATQFIKPCKAGIQACTNGIWGACVGQVVPSPETCDGQDNDCDGQIDNIPTTTKLMTQICTGSACGSGVQTCRNGSWSGCESPPTVCYSQLKGCTLQPGGAYQCQAPCQSGIQQCNNGQWSGCLGEITPKQEECNGRDDDCDGLVDNNVIPTTLCPNQIGVCKGSKQSVCKNGIWLPCSSTDYTAHSTQYETTETKCDGLDNDCDGQIDISPTQKLSLSKPCTACGGNGVQQCKQGQWDNCVNLCYQGTTGCTQQSDGSYQCLGQCTVGTRQCINNQWSTTCAGGNLPMTEVCNLLDDDCNGKIDDGLLHCVVNFSGNGQLRSQNGPPDQAGFYPLKGITIDNNGNIFAFEHCTIRKVDQKGYAVTIAGSGTTSNCVIKDGPTTSALFDEIYGIAVDRQGNLYVNQNYCVRKVDLKFNMVSTFAGNCAVGGFRNGSASQALFTGLLGITVTGSGDIFVVDIGKSSTIRRIDTNGNVSVFAVITSHAYNIEAIANDSFGNLYVSGGNRIYQIDTTGAVSTGSVTGFTFSSRPVGMAVGLNGNVYIHSDEQIFQLGKSGNVVVAGTSNGYKDGPASQAQFSNIRGLALDNLGNLYIADSGNHRIRKIMININDCTINGATRACYTGTQSTQGNGICKSGIQTCENGLWSVCTDQILPFPEICNGKDDDCDGSIDNNLQLGSSCAKTTGACFGSYQKRCVGGQSQTCTDADYKAHNPMYSTTELCDDVDNNCDGNNNENLTNCVSTVGTGEIVYGLAFDGQGDLYFISGSDRISKLDQQGNLTTVTGGSGMGWKDGSLSQAKFNKPKALVFDKSGTLYIADSGNHRIRKIDTNGNVTTYAGDGQPGYKDGSATQAQFANPTGIVIDLVGNIIVSDSSNYRIRKIDTKGNVTTLAGTGTKGYYDGPANQAQFDSTINGITIDTSGRLYVAESSQIRLIDTNGMVSTYAAGGLLNRAYDLVIDPAGNLYVSNDTQVLKIDTNRKVTTFAGTGNKRSKDGTLGSAEFTRLYSIALDQKGNIYIGQGDTNTEASIRKITLK